MTPPRQPNEGWQHFHSHCMNALLNARLTLVVGGADRPHFDALADAYADAALFTPSRETCPAARNDRQPDE